MWFLLFELCFIVFDVSLGIVSSGISVNIGMMVIFWNSSIENVFLFFFVCCKFFFWKVCSMIVVEDNVKMSFIVREILKGWFNVIVVVVISVVVSLSCNLFKFRSFDFMVYNEWGLSFRLIKNSIIIILNLVKCWIVVVLLFISLNIGLIIRFVIK